MPMVSFRWRLADLAAVARIGRRSRAVAAI
jgi:hypothetical protein